MKYINLTLNKYQELASSTARFPEGSLDGLVYTALGLNGEAGEFAENVKKLIRDDNSIITPERRESLIKELGDQLWYLSQAARVLGTTLEEVANVNINKLQSRAERGKIHGDGDNR